MSQITYLSVNQPYGDDQVVNKLCHIGKERWDDEEERDRKTVREGWKKKKCKNVQIK